MSYTVITAVSSGYTGAPGWHRMKFMGALTGAECNTAAANMKAFYTGIQAQIPSLFKMDWQSPAQTFDDHGVLTAETSITTLPTQFGGSAAGSYAGGVGAVVFWNTVSINGGKKVRGRTYLVPLTANVYDNAGILSSTARTAITGAAATLVAATPPLCVNSRANGDPSRGDQTVLVTSATLPNRTAVLRTRRG